MENEERGMIVTSYSVAEVKTQVNLIQELMKDVMHEDEHYGIIPGTKKKSLYKPGAEKLSMVFRLAPKYEMKSKDLGDGHIDVTSTCVLIHIPTGATMGEGIGSCSTMESKFRYRNVSGYDVLDEPIPNDSKDNKAAYRKQGFGMKKDDDLGWVWVKFRSSEKQENPDIADSYNTVRKMAKKRSHTDAILTVLAASDIFTQDYDEDADHPESQPPDYETEASAAVNIRACNTIEILKKTCDKYKEDYKAEKTGWTGPSWNRIVAVMTEVKNKFSTSDQKQEETVNQQNNKTSGDPPPISDDEMPAFMR